MKGNDVKAVHRADYKRPPFLVENITLTFDLFNDYTVVTNEFILKSLDEKKALVLYGEDIDLISIKLNDKELPESDYVIDGNNLTIDKTKEQFKLEIKTKIYPQNNTQLSGLYFVDGLFCTQCEAEGFRRMTYFLDRPDVLTIYTTKITADKASCPVLLSNGNLIDSGELDNGRHYAIWNDPFKKPSYLFALVAGDLACIEDSYTTLSSKEVVLKIYVEHGNEHLCAHAMNALKQAFKWDEQTYGLEYDLDIFMLVAVSTFNMGAMENKGLNIFNSKYVLADPQTATDADFAAILGVVGHEYFHNWTGNRVTCRDWFQLSLKEGLTVFRDQEFSRDMYSRDVNRIQDVSVLRAYQFPEDAGPMAHPVRPDSYIEINNFYTTTIYNKGAEVIRMQQALLGNAGFRKGMDLYFERHDGQAVTIDDFVCAMEDANDVDLTQFKRWYSQAGTPQVNVKTKFENGVLSLILSQYCPQTPEQPEKLPFVIPISLAIFNKEGKPYSLGTDLITLNEEKQTFTFDNIDEGAVVSLLRDFSAPIKLNFRRSNDELRTLIHYETNGFARFEAMQTLLKRHYHQLIDMSQKDEALTLDNEIAETISTLLKDEHIDMSLKAELITPLNFESIVADLKAVDVAHCVRVSDHVIETISERLEEELLEFFLNLKAKTTADMNVEAYAIRQLKNVCLTYLAYSSKHDELVLEQFNTATTMTDELGAFRLLVDINEAFGEQAVRQFYNKWKDDELVLDKWFSVQALSRSDMTISKVRELMSHDAFNMNNPNKVRALIGSFSMGNPRCFHSEQGYQLLYDVVTELDKRNPQIAARLITPFTRWRRYNSDTQMKMKTCLEALQENEGISKDSYEIISKSLASE